MAFLCFHACEFIICEVSIFQYGLFSISYQSVRFQSRISYFKYNFDHQVFEILFTLLFKKLSFLFISKYISLADF